MISKKNVFRAFYILPSDQASEDNAALTIHGWPAGVNMALIVGLSADGQTEVYRQHTPRLHTEIKILDGSHRKQFIIKTSLPQTRG